MLLSGNGQSGAYFEMSGEVANNATWQENIYFLEAGIPMDLQNLDFRMTFRSCGEVVGSSTYTLSTDDGTLTVVADPDSGLFNILYINVPVGNLTALCGDYVSDLASQDVAGVITPWAHGTVSFRPLPVSFT